MWGEEGRCRVSGFRCQGENSGFGIQDFGFAVEFGIWDLAFRIQRKLFLTPESFPLTPFVVTRVL
jgi:hypothetical protein